MPGSELGISKPDFIWFISEQLLLLFSFTASLQNWNANGDENDGGGEGDDENDDDDDVAILDAIWGPQNPESRSVWNISTNNCCNSSKLSCLLSCTSVVKSAS